MIGCFVPAMLFWMEPSTCGSLITTFVEMTIISLLPLDLLYLLLCLLFKGYFMPHLFPHCYYFPALNEHMVMQSTKTSSPFMPWSMYIINNMIVIKISIQILRLVIPFFLVSSMLMGTRAFLSSFSAMHTAMGWWWCVPIILFPRWSQQYLGSIWHPWPFSFGVSQACKLRTL